MQRPIRVLMAKPGLDGHDRGAKVVARGLRDAGFEVIYTGLHQTPEMVARAALQEDVDIVGLSIHSGAHLPLVTAVQKEMKSKKLKKPIFVGGIIPPDDMKTLLKQGVDAVFGPGTTLDKISSEVRDVVTGPKKTARKKKTKTTTKKKKATRKKAKKNTPTKKRRSK